MTLDEAIKHCLEVAEKNDGEAEVYDLLAKNHNNPYEKLTASRFHADCAECAADHRQLAEWLTELKEAKRLLKAAVDGYRFIGHITKDYACPSAASCSACPMDEGKQCRIWEHADEALALIGEEGDAE